MRIATDRAADVTALRELVAADGWRLLTQYAAHGWGAKATLDRIQAIARTPDAGEEMLRILAASEAINELMSWPTRQIETLAEQTSGVVETSMAVPRRA